MNTNKIHWIPKHGEVYYFVNAEGNVKSDKFTCSGIQITRRNVGNFFEDKAIAGFIAEEFKNILKSCQQQ